MVYEKSQLTQQEYARLVYHVERDGDSTIVVIMGLTREAYHDEYANKGEPKHESTLPKKKRDEKERGLVQIGGQSRVILAIIIPTKQLQLFADIDKPR